MTVRKKFTGRESDREGRRGLVKAYETETGKKKSSKGEEKRGRASQLKAK